MKSKSPNFKINPLFKGMSDFLKNPANFIPIQKQILETLASSHSHSDLEGYAKCLTCTGKMIERRKLLKRLGFKNPEQYLMWKRVHEEIAKSYPLVDWNTLNTQRAIEELKK